MKTVHQQKVQKMQFSASQKYLFTTITLLILSSVILGMGEVLARAFSKPIKVVRKAGYYMFDIRCGIHLTPGKSYKEFEKEVKINSLGFRSPEPSLKKSGKRIAFMGDSYTQGVGIDENDNFPFLTVNLLRETMGPELDFFNTGVGGSSPFQQYFIYLDKVRQFNPDLVVYSLYNNDLGDDFVFYYSEYYAHISIYRKIPKTLRKSRLIQRLALFFINRKSASMKAKYNTIRTQIKSREMWDRWTQPSLEKLYEKLKDKGSQLVLVFIPSINDFDGEFTEKHIGDEQHLDFSKWAANWAKKNHVPYLDLYPVLNQLNTPKLYEYYLPHERGFHLNEKGNQVFANLLADLIKEEIDL